MKIELILRFFIFNVDFKGVVGLTMECINLTLHKNTNPYLTITNDKKGPKSDTLKLQLIFEKVTRVIIHK
jgi:hypothetical protein